LDAHNRSVPRCARGTIDPGEYHVYTRSPGKIAFFRDDQDRTDFCNRLSTVVRKLDWRCMAFALMTSHYHLVLEVAENRLQPGMKWLNGTYAQRFNKRHGRWGHLCGSRYSIVPLESKRQRLRTFQYVALNPVRAGLVERPQDWLWSSYAGTAGYAKPFRFVDDRPIRECFGEDADGLEILRLFVEAAVDPLRSRDGGLSP
jgi:REP element-mobilizing transposase RayT